jgi:BirA family biotin operon repressor/biotin-[acetyl-CoA-carboxylase] ligase
LSKLGSIIHTFETLASTNDAARDLARQGADEGVGVVARLQTAGRGRNDRRWVSPEGEGLYLSLILRPRLAARLCSTIPLAAAIAVAETLREDFKLSPDIKWPNDVLISGRKVCGILVESAVEGDRLEYAILGVGVNVGQREFSDELKETATSVSIEAGSDLSPGEFLRPLLDRLDLWYRLAITQSQAVIARWEELSSWARGREVRALSANEEILGVTRGLTSEGGLLIETAGGEIREITSGEVSLRQVAQKQI